MTTFEAFFDLVENVCINTSKNVYKKKLVLRVSLLPLPYPHLGCIAIVVVIDILTLPGHVVLHA